jgi:RNA polymerase sigma-70 factor (ECF subfamily)
VAKDTQPTGTPTTVHELKLARIDIAVLAREHYGAVFRFCSRRVGIDHAADAAQETFVTAHKALSKFRGESTVTTWLFGIANNECRRISRKEKLAPMQLDVEFNGVAHSESEGSLVDRHALSEAMKKLSDEHREVVVLHELDGLTYEEAAEILGVPVGTVKSRLHHAFQHLRRLLIPAAEAAR